MLAAIRWNAYKTSAQTMTAERMVKEYYMKLYEPVVATTPVDPFLVVDQFVRQLSKQDIFNLLYAPGNIGAFSFELFDEDGNVYDRVNAKEAGLKYFNDKLNELGGDVVDRQVNDFVLYISKMLRMYSGSEDLVAWVEKMDEQYNGERQLVYQEFKKIFDRLIRDLINTRRDDIKKVKARDVLPRMAVQTTSWVSKFVKGMAGKVATYVSSEIAIPGSVFAGGLGKLAADTVYGATDLPGADMLFFTLKYRHGRKPVKGEDGQYRRERYVADYQNNVENIELIVDDETGEARMFNILMPVGPSRRMMMMQVQAWRQVFDSGQGGRATVIYIEDVNEIITDEIYAETGEWDRFLQELLLGKGTAAVMKGLNIKPDVLHLNEAATSLTAPAVLENPYFEGTRLVFATHTSVPAALRTYPKDYWDHTGYSRKYQRLFMHNDRLKLTEGVLSVVRLLKGKAYGVSKLHGIVSRNLFKKWQDLITHVTNGSFLPFWRHESLKTLAGTTEAEQRADLMARKKALKREMIDKVQGVTGVRLDEDDPIVFFGRRMAEYKRLGMTVHDEVAHTMLKAVEEGGLHMQYIISGIPYGEYGLNIIARVDELRNSGYRIVYMPDYDVNLEVNKMLFAGSDFMLHIPQRPHEASGTSYQMGAMNATIVGTSYDGGPLEHIVEFNEETREGNGVYLQEWAEGIEVGDVYAYGDAQSRRALVEMYRKMRRIYDNEEMLAAIRWNAYKTSAQTMTAERMVKEYYT
ncbi:MAG: glycogen/starch/alpha-glucan phosphorylase, partial [Candidatus Omnitrophica bacterium]|nr:glycogen/starch/alpha-glucan phosphorylase [Candidatus Omnitrophota bacterium]